MRATPFTLHERVALAISRGSQTENPAVKVQIEPDEIQGWGEDCVYVFSAGF